MKRHENVHTIHFYFSRNIRTEYYAFAPFPENCWIGASTDTANHAGTFTNILFTLNIPHKFISADPSSTQIGEPLLDDIAKYIDYDAIDWIIIGSLNRHGSPVPAEKACPRQRTESGTRKEWVLSILEQANKYNIPIFIKDALYRLYPDIPQRKNLPCLSSIPIRDKSNL